jgi:transcriptional regulator
MYVPQHFAPPGPEALAELLTSAGASDLVTVGKDGLACSMLPFLFEAGAGPAGALQGHLARANPQWRSEPSGEALVVVHGPNAYISPGWYATKAEHGRVVPTWDYVVAHVYGRLVVHDDPVWTENLVRRLTARHEAGRPVPWSPDDAPAGFIASELRAIVGAEVLISRIEGKWKLSQNRSDADIDGVAAGLEASGELLAREVAEAVRAARPLPRTAGAGAG